MFAGTEPYCRESGLILPSPRLAFRESVSDEDILREIAGLLRQPKSHTQMIGEFLREASVLIVVFAPLETLFNPDVSPWWKRRQSPPSVWS